MTSDAAAVQIDGTSSAYIDFQGKQGTLDGRIGITSTGAAATDSVFTVKSLGNLEAESAGDLAITTNSFERMRVASDGTIRIGANTNHTHQSSLLDLRFVTAPVTTGTGQNTLRLCYDGSAAAAKGAGVSFCATSIAGGTAAAVAQILGLRESSSNSAGKLSFCTNDGTSVSERALITSDGKFGVGVSAPSAQVSISSASTGGVVSMLRLLAPNNSVATEQAYRIGFGAVNGVAENTMSSISFVREATSLNNNSAITFSTSALANVGQTTASSAIERMRISSAGNVGIGVSIPTAMLDIEHGASSGMEPMVRVSASNGTCGMVLKTAGSSGGRAYMEIQDHTSNGSTTDSWAIGTNGSDSSIHFMYGTHSTGANADLVGKTSKMSLTTSGDLLIAGSIDIAKINNGTSEVAITPDSDITVTSAGALICTLTNRTVDVNGKITTTGDAEINGSVVTSTVKNGNNSFNIGSDIEFKHTAVTKLTVLSTGVTVTGTTTSDKYQGGKYMHGTSGLSIVQDGNSTLKHNGNTMATVTASGLSVSGICSATTKFSGPEFSNGDSKMLIATNSDITFKHNDTLRATVNTSGFKIDGECEATTSYKAPVFIGTQFKNGTSRLNIVENGALVMYVANNKIVDVTANGLAVTGALTATSYEAETFHNSTSSMTITSAGDITFRRAGTDSAAIKAVVSTTGFDVSGTVTATSVSASTQSFPNSVALSQMSVVDASGNLQFYIAGTGPSQLRAELSARKLELKADCYLASGYKFIGSEWNNGDSSISIGSGGGNVVVKAGSNNTLHVADQKIGINRSTPSTTLDLLGEGEVMNIRGSTQAFMKFYSFNHATKWDGMVGVTSSDQLLETNSVFTVETPGTMKVLGGSKTEIGCVGNLTALNIASGVINVRVNSKESMALAEGTIHMYTSEQVRMTIDSNGNVGIGDTSPNATLHVKTATTAEPLAILEAENGDASLVIKSAGANGGASYVEIQNLTTSGSALNSWSIGVDGSTSLIMAYGAHGDMPNKTTHLTLTDAGALSVTSFEASAVSNGKSKLEIAEDAELKLIANEQLTLVVDENKVGINAANPTKALVVKSDAEVMQIRGDSSAFIRFYGFNDDAHSDGLIGIQLTDGTNKVNSVMSVRGEGHLDMYGKQSSKLTCDANVGVEITATMAKLRANNVEYMRATDSVLNLKTSGINRLNVDANGQVGIGTNSPGALLHVTATTDEPMLMVEGTDGDASIILKSSGAAGGQAYLEWQNHTSGSTTDSWAVGVDGSTTLFFGYGPNQSPINKTKHLTCDAVTGLLTAASISTASVENGNSKMSIANNGNFTLRATNQDTMYVLPNQIGINKSTPTAPLVVASTAASAELMQLRGMGTGGYMAFYSWDDDSKQDGKIGITSSDGSDLANSLMTVSSTGKMEVNSVSSTKLKIGANAAAEFTPTAAFLRVGANPVFHSTATTTEIKSGGDSRIFCDGSGNIGFNQTTPIAMLHASASTSKVPMQILESSNGDVSLLLKSAGSNGGQATLDFRNNSATGNSTNGWSVGIIDANDFEIRYGADNVDASTKTEKFKLSTAGQLTTVSAVIPTINVTELSTGNVKAQLLTDEFNVQHGSTKLFVAKIDTGVTTVSLQSNRLQDVTDPTSAQDAATKAYVDASVLSNKIWAIHDSDNKTYVSAADSFADGTGETDQIHFVTSGTEKMRIMDDGKLGIGVNAPLSMLDVRSTVDEALTLHGSATLNKSFIGFYPSGGAAALGDAARKGHVGMTRATEMSIVSTGTMNMQSTSALAISSINSTVVVTSSGSSNWTNTGALTLDGSTGAILKSTSGSVDVTAATSATVSAASGSLELSASGAASLESTTGLASIIGSTEVRAVTDGSTVVSIKSTKQRIGASASANGGSSIALGNESSSGGTASVALGFQATTSNPNTIAVGAESVAQNTSAAAFGHGAEAKGNSALAVGTSAIANAAAAIAVGFNINTTGVNSVCVGKGITCSASAMCLNATSNAMEVTDTGMYIKGIDNDATNTSGLRSISYDPLTYKLTYNTQTIFTTADGASLAGTQITGLSSPTQNDHAANKAYVDAAIGGLGWIDSVRSAESTGNVTLDAQTTIGTVAVSLDDRILLLDQTDAKENGVWIYKGDSAWVRPLDFAVGASAKGKAMFVNEGTMADTAYVCNTDDASDTIGTHDLNFVIFAGSGAVQVDSSLVKNANTLSLASTIPGVRTFDADVQSTSATTGTIVVTGGVGMSGHCYVGGDMHVDKAIGATGSSIQFLTTDKIVNIYHADEATERLSVTATGVTVKDDLLVTNNATITNQLTCGLYVSKKSQYQNKSTGSHTFSLDVSSVLTEIVEITETGLELKLGDLTAATLKNGDSKVTLGDDIDFLIGGSSTLKVESTKLTSAVDIHAPSIVSHVYKNNPGDAANTSQILLSANSSHIEFFCGGTASPANLIAEIKTTGMNLTGELTVSTAVKAPKFYNGIAGIDINASTTDGSITFVHGSDSGTDVGGVKLIDGIAGFDITGPIKSSGANAAFIGLKFGTDTTNMVVSGDTISLQSAGNTRLSVDGNGAHAPVLTATTSLNTPLVKNGLSSMGITSNSDIEFKHNNVTKLKVVETGVEVTGALTATSYESAKFFHGISSMNIEENLDITFKRAGDGASAIKAIVSSTGFDVTGVATATTSVAAPVFGNGTTCMQISTTDEKLELVHGGDVVLESFKGLGLNPDGVIIKTQLQTTQTICPSIYRTTTKADGIEMSGTGIDMKIATDSKLAVHSAGATVTGTLDATVMVSAPKIGFDTTHLLVDGTTKHLTAKHKDATWLTVNDTDIEFSNRNVKTATSFAAPVFKNGTSSMNIAQDGDITFVRDDVTVPIDVALTIGSTSVATPLTLSSDLMLSAPKIGFNTSYFTVSGLVDATQHDIDFFHNDNKKLSITSLGVTITGVLTANEFKAQKFGLGTKTYVHIPVVDEELNLVVNDILAVTCEKVNGFVGIGSNWSNNSTPIYPVDIFRNDALQPIIMRLRNKANATTKIQFEVGANGVNGQGSIGVTNATDASGLDRSDLHMSCGNVVALPTNQFRVSPVGMTGGGGMIIDDAGKFVLGAHQGDTSAPYDHPYTHNFTLLTRQHVTATNLNEANQKKLVLIASTDATGPTANAGTGIGFGATQSAGLEPVMCGAIVGRRDSIDDANKAGSLTFHTAVTGTNPSNKMWMRLTSAGQLSLREEAAVTGDGVYAKLSVTTRKTLPAGNQILRLEEAGNASSANEIPYMLSFGTTELDGATPASINFVRVKSNTNYHTALAFCTSAVDDETTATTSSWVERMRIGESGLVGIGTSAPDALLHAKQIAFPTGPSSGVMAKFEAMSQDCRMILSAGVASTTDNNCEIEFRNLGPAAGGVDASGKHQVWAAGTRGSDFHISHGDAEDDGTIPVRETHLYIKKQRLDQRTNAGAEGWVGINTINPQALLHVVEPFGHGIPLTSDPALETRGVPTGIFENNGGHASVSIRSNEFSGSVNGAAFIEFVDNDSANSTSGKSWSTGVHGGSKVLATSDLIWAFGTNDALPLTRDNTAGVINSHMRLSTDGDLRVHRAIHCTTLNNHASANLDLVTNDTGDPADQRTISLKPAGTEVLLASKTGISLKDLELKDIATPTTNTSATNKAYVDSAITAATSSVSPHVIKDSTENTYITVKTDVVGSADNNQILMATSGDQALVILSDGKTGIGSAGVGTAPTEKLGVDGSIVIDGSFKQATGSNLTMILQHPNAQGSPIETTVAELTPSTVMLGSISKLDKIPGDECVIIGFGCEPGDEKHSIRIGPGGGFLQNGANAIGRNIAIGANTYCNLGVDTVALGTQIEAHGNQAVCIGFRAASHSTSDTDVDGVAIGTQAVTGKNGVVIGHSSTTIDGTENQIAIGTQSTAGGNQIALGYNIKEANGSICLRANVSVDASDPGLTPTAGAFHVTPVRNLENEVTNTLYYNPGTGEISYSTQDGAALQKTDERVSQLEEENRELKSRLTRIEKALGL